MTLYFARKPRILLLLFLLVTSTALFYTITYRDTRKMGSAAPLRLAILEADTPQPQTRDRYGGYTGVFTALLNAAANSLKPPQKLDEIVTIKGYDVVNELHSYPALEDIDAILITGSKHTAFDNDPWILKLVEYTKKAIETDPAGGSDALKKSYEDAKRAAAQAKDQGSAAANRSAPGGGGGGMPDLSSLAGMFGGGGGGGGGGMPDLSSIMSNPMFANMAQKFMQNPEMMEGLMNNPNLRQMADQFSSGGGMPDMGALMSDPNIADM